jgi:hypothetical protein
MRKKLRWILLGAALLLAGLVGVMTYRPKHEPLRRIPLPDGTEVRLEYVTYGTDHRAPGAGRLAGWLSQQAQRWPRLEIPYEATEYQHETSDPVLGLWFTHFDPRTKAYIPGIEQKLSLSAVNSGDYLEFESSRSWNPYGGVLPMPHLFVTCPRFERRKANVSLRVTMLGQTSELTVPNPAADVSFPQWKPEPLPQTRRMGELDLVLRSVSFRRDEDGKLVTPPALNPVFEVLHHGKESQGIDGGEMKWFDATGNQSIGQGDLLSFSERAWKLRVTAFLVEGYPMSRSEGVVLDPVPLPGSGQIEFFRVPERGRKERLSMAIVVGPGRYVFQDGSLQMIGEPLTNQDEIRAFLFPAVSSLASAPGQPPVPSLDQVLYGEPVRPLRINAIVPTCIFFPSISENAKGQPHFPPYLTRIEAGHAVGKFGLGIAIPGTFAGREVIPITYPLQSADAEGRELPPPGTPVTAQLLFVEDVVHEFIVAPPAREQ